jgi:hypothetical protein
MLNFLNLLPLTCVDSVREVVLPLHDAASAAAAAAVDSLGFRKMDGDGKVQAKM